MILNEITQGIRRLWEQTEKENEKDNENAQEQTIAYVHLEKGM